MSIIVDYYFTPQSPWAYLGSKRFAEIVKKYDAAVAVKPIDLGKAFSVSGGLPLAKRPPQRQAYRLQELARWRKKLDMPLVTHPSHFPLDAKPSSLMIIAARMGGQDSLALANAIGAALWAEDRNIGDWGVLVDVADKLGMDGKGLKLAAETNSEVEQDYEIATDEAITRDVFGAPTYYIDGELFWGQDRLEFVEDKLAGR
ncbi:2-hydroxychromene-2-carboxylate isomerase [Oceanibaculum pacificum]|uniref:2-hydroxychromene-2-carboxylate isomerase n=1 Tax=Oceanibaculum pacificum TaxID=580166 RepID=A0A154VTU3_9PROT|nr:2-hydroxychromene-2-carboxylate isomerase [Oceanibaculum pacificum]KZD04686.1 2-hydroxychromene-2-carboxylate isomerase [Oceanibaculum pacificum]